MNALRDAGRIVTLEGRGLTPGPNPFALDADDFIGSPGVKTRGSALARLALSAAAPIVERVLGLSTLGRLYRDATGATLVEDFPERALVQLGVTWRADGPGAGAIPANGPLVIVANHPFGAADGLILLALARQVRPDVRLLGNYVLGRIPELRPLLLEVDPFARPGSHAMNARMVRRAVDWTKRGGALIVFPAGEVASVAAAGGRLIDAPWRHGMARIVAQSEAAVVPVCFDGRNSRLFELAGRVHPLLRTALLPRELLRQRGASVHVTVGATIRAARLDGLEGASAVTSYLRARTYALVRPRAAAEPAAVAREPIVQAVAHDVLAREVAGLPADRTLLAQGALKVFCVSADDAPSVLREIGRLREIAFRAVGEGTGRSADLDRFDRHYLHLFVWHDERGEVVGAYRLAPTDVVLRAHGPRGLYTGTLFRYGRAFLGALGPAIELGRSFVRVEYQREYLPLALLWRGIIAFMTAHPRYRRLIGPVSISASYAAVSRDALVNLLEQPALRSPLAALVRPRTPYRRSAVPSAALSMAEVSHLIKEIEPAGPAMPVLLRQYLKLDARTIATSVDPAFANVVDVLMVVDAAAPLLPARLARRNSELLHPAPQRVRVQSEDRGRAPGALDDAARRLERVENVRALHVRQRCG